MNTTPNLPNQTPEQLRAFLTSLIKDANFALAAIADGEYERAAEELRCLDVDAQHIVQGIERLAWEKAQRGRCCNDVCERCERLDAAEWR